MTTRLVAALELACKDLSDEYMGGCPVAVRTTCPAHCADLQDGPADALKAECAKHLDGGSPWRCWAVWYRECAAEEQAVGRGVRVTDAICQVCGATLTDAERDAGDACADCSAEPPREVVIVIPGEAKTECKRQRFIQGRGIGKRVDVPDRAAWKARVSERAFATCREPFRGPLFCEIELRRVKPASYPKRATKTNPWPNAWWKKPDVDNYVKLLFDALTGIVWLDDAQVTDLHVSKRFGERDEVIVTIREAREEAA